MAKRSKEKSLYTPWSQAEFARLAKTDQAVISRLISRGILTRGATCRTWIAEIISHYAEIAAGRTAENLNLADERAKLARAQAAKIGFDLARARQEFRSVDAIAHELSALFSIVRSRLLALPNHIHGEHRLSPKVFVSIEKIIRDALDELAIARLPADLVALVNEINDEAFRRATENPEAETQRNGPAVSGAQQQNN